MNKKENFLKGFIKENPLFVLLLGTCPALAITTSLENALGMGVAFIFVLVMSNTIISLINSFKKLKELIQPVRIAVYIVIIASLVTIVEMLMQAYLPDLYNSLGVFISLITVNCIVLGRAEAYASSNTVGDSVIDGISMGLGYTLALIIISIVRELLGNGTITIWGDLQLNLQGVFDFLHITTISFFTSSAGAFMVLGIVLAIMQAIKNGKEEKAKEAEKAKKEVK
ncbi:electron transport complex subunit RsxE [bacterium]|nr:electron transport complex subunit RsxE [bacterium]